jgi:hypothetical protein
MTKHTPGPWRYEESTKTIRAVPSNYWLATMDSWDGAVKPSNDANARLMAAAPELLALLTRAQGILKPNSGKWTKAETARSWAAWLQEAQSTIDKIED